MGNCDSCWLKQDLCLAEAEAEAEEAGGFCKLVDDNLEVRFPMPHEGTVVNKQYFQDSLLHGLSLDCQSATVEQGAVKPIS